MVPRIFELRVLFGSFCTGENVVEEVEVDVGGRGVEAVVGFIGRARTW
jgi:hypothetical protein